MCGFLGSFGLDTELRDLSPYFNGLFNRGPDFQELTSIDKYCHMGVARLAMTDPHPRSNQPMWDSKRNSALSFNGEIYNYLQIKKDLENQGFEFKTESDTEVLLTLLGIDEKRVFKQIKGMFAFAFYNNETKKLILSRDKLGKKPLFYIHRNNCVFWSSSLKVLKDVSNSVPVTASKSIDFFALGYQIDPSTSYQEIMAVLPGHSIEFELLNEQMHITHTKNDLSSSVRISLRENLWQAIEARTKNHQKVALSLSGGIDSSLIALGLAEQGQVADTYSAFWSNSDKERYNSDRSFAEIIAHELGHNFNPIDISKNFELEKLLREFLTAMEEPNNNPTGLSTLQLYREIAKDGHRLLLTGDGSDEIFAGYKRHSLSMKYPRILRTNNMIFDKYLSSGNSTIKRIITKALMSQLNPENPIYWLNWHWVFTPAEQQSLFRNVVPIDEIQKIVCNEIEKISPVSKSSKAVEILMQRDHEIWLSMESNRKLDRLSMYFSIEARSPFQDEDVIASGRKMMQFSNYGLLEKTILKREFPELQKLTIKREKVGFTSPVGHWMRDNPEFINDSLEYLGKQPDWNYSAVSSFRNSQFKGDYRTNMQLWTLTVYSTWLRMLSES